MPCTSHYPEPSDLNRRLQMTAYCYLYLDGVLRKHTPTLPNYSPLSGLERKLVKKTSEDYYASEDFVPRLCGVLRTLKKMEPKLFEKVVQSTRRI